MTTMTAMMVLAREREETTMMMITMMVDGRARAGMMAMMTMIATRIFSCLPSYILLP